jgi:hypothetical protein
MGCTNSKPPSTGPAPAAVPAKAATATKNGVEQKAAIPQEVVTPQDVISASVNQNNTPEPSKETSGEKEAPEIPVEELVVESIKSTVEEVQEEEVVESPSLAVIAPNEAIEEAHEGGSRRQSEDCASETTEIEDDSAFRGIEDEPLVAQLALQELEENDPMIEPNDVKLDVVTSSPKEGDDLPMKKGFIARQCKEFGKGWKSRFFVLHKGTLYFYESESLEEPFGINKEGEIILDGATIVSKENKITLSSKLSQDMVIDIRLKGERIIWIQAIEDHIAHYSIPK